MPLLIPPVGTARETPDPVRAEDLVSRALGCPPRQYTYILGTDGSAWYQADRGLAENFSAAEMFKEVLAPDEHCPRFWGAVLVLTPEEFQQRIHRSPAAIAKHYSERTF